MKDRCYATEADLCAAFIAGLPAGWTAYPETAGWDILLVRSVDGVQIGVEAKLRLNAKVICQALEDHYGTTEGPDFRAVLVPRSSDFGPIADCLGITVLLMRRDGYSAQPFYPPLPGSRVTHADNAWHDRLTTRRHSVPAYVPDVAAGSSAPVKLTDWKIGAIKIAIILERRGYVVREDFKHVHIDHRRWMPRQQGWLAAGENGWIAGSSFPDLKGQHPKVYAEIAASFDAWKPPAIALARQRSLPLRDSPQSGGSDG